MSYVVINNPALAEERAADSARVVVHIDALEEHLARGWELVGPCSDRYREPLLADDEQFLADQARADLEASVAAEAARIAAEIEAANTPPAEPGEVNPDSTDGEPADGTTKDQE